jgi:hypothetical protein
MPDIKETKEALAFVLSLGNALGTTLADGKITLSEAPQFMGALMAAPAAFQGLTEVPAELKDLDDAEKAELMAFVQSEFDIPNDQIEGVIEEGLALALAIYTFVEKVRAL